MDAESYTKAIRRQFQDASEATKRMIALAACKLVVTRALRDDRLVRAALQALETGTYGDSRLAEKLQQHVCDLDDRYLAAQDEYRAGRTDEKTYQESRAKARAAEAVLCAFDRDPTLAMSNAVYVACAAIGVEPVNAEINRVVGQAVTSME